MSLAQERQRDKHQPNHVKHESACGEAVGVVDVTERLSCDKKNAAIKMLASVTPRSEHHVDDLYSVLDSLEKGEMPIRRSATCGLVKEMRL